MAKKPVSFSKPADLSLRELRAATARLRAAGLLSPLTKIERERGLRDEKTPGILRAIKKFKGFLEGTEGVVSKSEVQLNRTALRSRGLRTVKASSKQGEKILVPKFKDESVQVRNKSIEFTSKEGKRVQRLELPNIRHDTQAHFFEDLHKIGIDNLRKQYPGYSIGARFFNNRTVLYSLSQLPRLLNTLQTYDTVVAAHGRKQTAEVLRNIELILVPTPPKPVGRNW